jgi:endonuclease III
MTKKERARLVNAYLTELFPDPKCELNFNQPYELLFAVIMSAQTTDKQVNKLTSVLFQKYTSLEDYINIDLEEFTQDISSIGLYRGKAKNIQKTAELLLNKYNGVIPRTVAEIIEFPGAARKTANVVLWELYRLAEGIAVDTHVKRLSNQLKLTTHDDVKKIELDLMKLFPQGEWGDVSHRLILYGRYYWAARREDNGKLSQILGL